MHILSLPTELTRIIFDYACQSSRLFYFYKAKLSMLCVSKESIVREEGQELAISHVCQSWRETSIHYPDLWETFNHFPKYSRYHAIERFTTYAERAQSNVLDIWIDVFAVNDMDLVVNVLKSHTQRLRRLALFFHDSFQFDSYQASDINVPCGPGTYENLQILYVVSAAFHQADYPQWFEYLIRDAIFAPNLVSLQIDCRLIVRPAISATTCYTSLCNLDLTFGELFVNYDTRLLLQMLSNFPNLITLSITGEFEESQSLDPFKLVILPKLKYYQCVSSGFATFTTGRYFRAPQLEIMILWEVEDSMTWRDQDSESFPMLKTLVLIGCSVDGRSGSTLVNLTQRIGHLIVFNAEITPFWSLEHLALDAWPHLEELSLRQRNATRPVTREWEIDPKETIPRFVDMMVRRKEALPHKSLNLRMGANLARQFLDATPDLWGELEAAVATVETVPASVWPDDDDAKFHIPWPPPADDFGFYRSLRSDTSRATVW